MHTHELPTTSPKGFKLPCSVLPRAYQMSSPQLSYPTSHNAAFAGARRWFAYQGVNLGIHGSPVELNSSKEILQYPGCVALRQKTIKTPQRSECGDGMSCWLITPATPQMSQAYRQGTAVHATLYPLTASGSTRFLFPQLRLSLALGECYTNVKRRFHAARPTSLTRR